MSHADEAGRGDAGGAPRIGDFLGGGLIVGDREEQEDDYLVASFDAVGADGCVLLAIVADGLGGHSDGADASRAGVEGFLDVFGKSEGGVAKRLREGLDGANKAIRPVRDRDEMRLDPPGCTLVACAVTEDGDAHWISVGDSVLLHLRGGPDGTIARLNEDHSARPEFEEWVRKGRLTPEEFKTAPVHQVYSALMGYGIEEIDEGKPPVRLEPGDRLVVATDGLDTLTDPAPGLPAADRYREILSLCGEGRAMDAIASELLAEVENRAQPRQDNTTVVAYRHPEGALPGGIGKEFRTLLGPRP